MLIRCRSLVVYRFDKREDGEQTDQRGERERERREARQGKALTSVWTCLLLSESLGSQEMSYRIYTYRVYTDREV